MAKTPITYSSIPVYNFSYVANSLDPSFIPLAIWTDFARKEDAWTCEDWITYFAALKNKYGESQAKEIWSKYWLAGVSKTGGGTGDARAGSGLGYDSVPLDCRSFNAEFRAFIQKFKLEDTVYTNLGNLAKPLGTGADVVNSVSSAASSTGKVLKYGIPILVAGAIGLALWYGVRKVKNS